MLSSFELKPFTTRINCMALVTITGYPCSGKTTRAKELAQFLKEKLALPSTSPGLARLKIVIVNDESLGISKAAYDGVWGEIVATVAVGTSTEPSLDLQTVAQRNPLEQLYSAQSPEL